MTFHDVQHHVCRQCGHVITVVQNWTSSMGLKSGDKNVCIECGHVTIYDTNLLLREPTGDEYRQINADVRLRRLQQEREKRKKKFNWQKRREGKT